MTDSYKLTHWPQYPPDTEFVQSYITSRGGMFYEVLWFGAQASMRQLAGKVVEPYMIDEAENLAKQHFGFDYFNTKGWQHIVNDHGGKLPLIIKAAPEGCVIPVQNVLMTVENTCKKCFWLTSYMETFLLKVWYATTVATLSYHMKKSLQKHVERTGTMDLLKFKLHDFGYRGVSSEESAGIAGAAHLVNFAGTDTLAAFPFIKKYYDTTEIVGFSVAATEHSVISSWGRDSETQAYAHLMDEFPDGLLSIVSDTYNLWEAIEKKIGGELRDKVIERGGTLVVRPDSGNPVEVVLKVLDILADRFGYETNDKGYRVLNPKVRVIQGDGMNYWTLNDLFYRVTRAGWSADNLVVGMGGALLQQVNRDTQKFAMKCCNITRNGIDYPVYKDPVTDPGKKSLAGRLHLHRFEKEEGVFHWTTAKGTANEDPDDMLKVIFKDGELYNQLDFHEVRANSGTW